MRALRDVIADLIREEGPISVARYMGLCLGHPTLGYYTTRDPFGADGDFITAPEISQMFGELIGLWAAQTWLDQGRTPPIRLIEIGPGRGALMADALRAIARAAPPLVEGARVTLVETSPVLEAKQRAALQGAPAGVSLDWAQATEPVLDGPAVILANELLDALPVRQFQRTASGWRERLVGLDAAGGLVFGLSEPVSGSVAGPGWDAPMGAIIEVSPAADALVGAVAGHVARTGGAALFIDYGSDRSGWGDTLQAMRRHAFVDPLAAPGEADLTVQIDFARVAALARAAGAGVHGPVTQAAFLDALGLARRAATLKARATPEQAARIDGDVARLTDGAERGMGGLFKVIAFTTADAPAPPGFA
jgi:SAM-dependent MidA family methyltransferase